jgi:hypothetical protein
MPASHDIEIIGLEGFLSKRFSLERSQPWQTRNKAKARTGRRKRRRRKSRRNSV